MIFPCYINSNYYTGLMSKVFIIGIAGGSGSGKTFFANALAKRLGPDRSLLLYQDHYYFDQSSRFDRDGGAVNFDHPDSIDFDLLASHLRELKNGNQIQVPQYDFSTHSRLDLTIPTPSKSVVIVDGILILGQPQLLNIFDESVFIQTSQETRFARRLKRDVEERGRTPEGVKAQFDAQVSPMHDQYVEPSKLNATHINSGVDMEAFHQLLQYFDKKLSL